MSSDAAALRRLWWVPALVLVAGDLAFALLLRGPLEGVMARRALLRYLPLALHLLPRLALFAWAWPRLREGGAFQALLAIQAALPLLFFALAHGVVPGLVARGALGGTALWSLFRLLPPLLEGTALGLAFRLRRREPEEGGMAVTVSAGFALLGGGWALMGLLPVGAGLFRDPLREELCGGSPLQASRAGFLTLLALPLAALAGLAPFGGRLLPFGSLADGLALPALLLGAGSWARLGGRLGPAGRGWRVLTWLGLGLVALLGIAAGLLVLALNGH